MKIFFIIFYSSSSHHCSTIRHIWPHLPISTISWNSLFDIVKLLVLLGYLKFQSILLRFWLLFIFDKSSWFLKLSSLVFRWLAISTVGNFSSVYFKELITIDFWFSIFYSQTTSFREENLLFSCLVYFYFDSFASNSF